MNGAEMTQPGAIAGAAERTGMRVLVLFGNIPMHGQERANIHVFEELRPRGVECLFVTNRDWGHQSVQPALDERGLPWTVAVFAGRFERKMGSKRWIRTLFDVTKASFQLLGICRRFRPTHIHVASPAMFANFLPALLLLNQPMVYRIGDTPATHRLIYRILWKWLIVRRVGYFVCDSRFIRDRLLQLGVAPDRAEVLYPPPPFRPRSTAGSALPQRDPACTTFVYVGQIGKHKGVDLFLAAARRLLEEKRDVRFLIAGDYSWQNLFAGRLIREVAEARLSDAIRFLGYVEDIDALFEVADVHVCPSVFDEPLGLVVMEAKAAGRPSIIFPSGGLPEMVEHDVDGFICGEKTVEALADALRAYAGDPAKVAEQKANAARSLARFEKPRFADRWLTVLRKVQR